MHRLIWSGWLFCWVTLGTLTVTYGCAAKRSTVGTLSFETVESNASPTRTGQQAYTGVDPALFVFLDAQSIGESETWFTAEGRNRLDQLRYDREFGLVVFQGWQLSDGYGVDIDRIEQLGEVIRVFARFQTPARSNAEGGVVTSPYQLVFVERPTLSMDSFVFEVYVEGERVAVYPDLLP